MYWDIKKDHFDKVVCFGSTLWYFVYYHDVEIIEKLIKKPMKTYFGAQGFHMKDKDFYFNILTKSGYKVVVVDQIENCEMMKDRIHQEADKGKKRRFRTEVCKREISHIYSRGTYFNPNTSEDNNSTFDTQYILVFHFNSDTDEFGFTFFDISELKFYVGSFVDDTVMSKFRTLISRIRPVEIV